MRCLRQPGEIWVRSSAAIQGYFSGGKESDKPIDGWMGTGDIGYISDELPVHLWSSQRHDYSRGREHHPSEIEAVCSSTREEVKAVGIEHDTWGEEVGVVMKLQASATADADAIKSFW